jgi:acyl-CoA synthetase (AMP-forming)/AMP-acid ligase II
MLVLHPSAFPRLSKESIEWHRRTGAWRNRTIVDDLREIASTEPDRILYRDERSAIDGAELLCRVESLASSLRRWGVRPIDVVSFQLPNWLEAAVVDIACAMIGAISNPISIIYRSAELREILAAAGSRVIFVPGLYRNRDYPTEAATLRRDLPDLQLIVTVRDDRPLDGLTERARFEDLSAGSGNMASWPRIAPESVKLLMYTSGTTGRPKGALHSHETSARTLESFHQSLGLSTDDVMFMPSTVTHTTGYAYGIQLPLLHRTTTVFMDGWDPRRAHRLIADSQATVTVGAVPFLLDLADVVAATGEALPSIRYFGCGGAAVTPTVIEKGMAAFPNARIFRIYGSTETGNVTAGFVGAGEQHLATQTDGRVADCEVRLMPVAAADPQVEEGEILVRGPGTFIGYTDPAENTHAFTADGFFKTGDVGALGDHGSLTITGRTKDIIIRGGYNVSAKEVEDHLSAHPLVREVAVVGARHPRLGETISAFVIPADPAHPPSLADLVQFLDLRELAKQKYPEAVYITASLPKTPAGKIQKYLLREMINSGTMQTFTPASAL